MIEANMDLDGLKTIDLTLFGDYCGHGLVGKANYLYCKELLARYKGFYDCFGGYGAYCIGYIEEELTSKGKQALEDILSSLANYTLLDDSIYCDMEEEAKQELIEDTIKEYTRKINNILDITGHDFALPKEETEYIREFIYNNAELENDYFYLPNEEYGELEKRYTPELIYTDLAGQEVKKILVCPDYYFANFGIVHVDNSTIYREITIYDFYPERYNADIMSQIKGGKL